MTVQTADDQSKDYISPTVERAWVTYGMHYGRLKEIKTRRDVIVVYSIYQRAHVGLLHADNTRTVHRIVSLGPQNEDIHTLQAHLFKPSEKRAPASFIGNENIKEQGEFAATCAVCGEVQFDTPSGAVCTNGHGGAESRPRRPNIKKVPKRQLWYHPESEAYVETLGKLTEQDAMQLVEVTDDPSHEALFKEKSQAAGGRLIMPNRPRFVKRPSAPARPNIIRRVETTFGVKASELEQRAKPLLRPNRPRFVTPPKLSLNSDPFADMDDDIPF